MKSAESEFEDLVNKILLETSQEILEEIIPITPVDTGDLQGNYKIIDKNNNISIINDLHYSQQILVLGRTGPRKGSLQLPDGILPFLKRLAIKKGGNLKWSNLILSKELILIF